MCQNEEQKYMLARLNEKCENMLNSFGRMVSDRVFRLGFFSFIISYS